MKPNNNMTEQPRSYRKLWLSLATVMTLSFLVLGYYGTEIYRQAPPVPEAGGDAGRRGAVHRAGHQGRAERLAVDGRPGGGHVWGHGAYVAPDWSADWLHREATWLLDHWAAATDGKPFASARRRERQAALKERLKLRNPVEHIRPRDAATWSSRRCGPRRSRPSSAHYAALFGDDPALRATPQRLRDSGQRDQDPGAAAAD